MMIAMMESILWRRLDSPGHDACRIDRTEDGWRLDGTAVFRDDGIPARLAYRVTCDTFWRTREGFVSGWVGERAIDFVVRHTRDRVWTLNGKVVPGLDACIDLDFGFTPATNLFQLRRIDLQVGEAADVPVAWLDVSSDALSLLLQRYERRTEGIYWYEAPGFDYAAILEVDSVGFARRYPGLWEAES